MNSLLQLNVTSHVVNDHCRLTAFIGQRHLSINSLLGRCDVTARTIAQSLALDLLRAAAVQQCYFGEVTITVNLNNTSTKS